MYGKACMNTKEMFGRMFEHCRKEREEVKLKTKSIKYEITRIS
jgi:hypothetical protein